MLSRTRKVLSLLVFFLSTSLLAATPVVQALVPGTAPHGARVVVTGSGLDAPDVSVTFVDSAGAPGQCSRFRPGI